MAPTPWAKHYLSEVHRRLHLEFSANFVDKLPAGKFDDPWLATYVEIVLSADGFLRGVGVVRSSGDERYDLEALNAVIRSAPFPAPAPPVRSSDGLTYLRWWLRRNASGCDPAKAQLFALPNDPHDPATSPVNSGGSGLASAPQAEMPPTADVGPPAAEQELTPALFTAIQDKRPTVIRPGCCQPFGGDRADVIAHYLVDFHRHLHVQFAHHFIGSLPTTNSDLADPRLATEVEIVLEPSGKLHSLAIVRSSGNERYDYGALNAVHRGAPYPAPPIQFLSPDEKAYLHWQLLRNESQCGLWNATPFIRRKDAQ